MEGINEFSQLEATNLLILLLEHIESRIKDFAQSNAFKKNTKKKDEEVHYTTILCHFLTKKQDKFTFNAEIKQIGTRRIDVGVMSQDTDELFFTIEAKILPMPEPKKAGKTRDTHEYVYQNKGNGAGIQRFKDVAHGLDFEDSPIEENGMIAYIKDNTKFSDWLLQVNQWITDAGWGEEEHLRPKTDGDENYTYQSKHKRTTKGKVTLHHFWVKVV